MNRKEDKLCLRWADFQENTVSAFGELRGDKEFTDITLACEDGQQVEAHKVILASSSPFFVNLLRRNKHPHPLVYMRGLKSEDILALVDFIYYGEANVYQDNLDSFLAVARELQLKGLTGRSAEEEAEEVKVELNKKLNSSESVQHGPKAKLDTPNSSANLETESPLEKDVDVTEFPVAADLQELDGHIKGIRDQSAKKEAEEKPKPSSEQEPIASQAESINVTDYMETVAYMQDLEKPSNKAKTPKNILKNMKTKQEPDMFGSLALMVLAESEAAAGYMQDLEEQIKSMMEHTDNTISSYRGRRYRGRVCKVCGKMGSKTNIRNHIEVNHITPIPRNCNICGKVLKSRNSLNVHKHRFHKNFALTSN